MAQPTENTENTVYPWHLEKWRFIKRTEPKLPHALLFYGPSGTGIDTFAETFAKALLCENRPENGDPCNACESCHWFDLRTHPDYRAVMPEALEIARGIEPSGDFAASAETETSSAKSSREPSRKIGIDRIRALADFINISTHRGGRRIVFIYPAEAMTSESSNALLKMLEEPPPQTLFILLAHHPDALLPTIMSRCFKVAFSMPDHDLACDWLTRQGIANAENWLAQEGGAPVQALIQAQQGEREEMTILLNTLSMPDDAALLAAAEKLQKVPMGDILTWYQRWLCDMLLLRGARHIRYYPAYRQQLEKAAARADSLQLAETIRESGERKRVADHPLVARLAIEDMLLDYRKIFSP